MAQSLKEKIAIAHIKHNGGRATQKQIEKFCKYPDQMIINLGKRLGL